MTDPGEKKKRKRGRPRFIASDLQRETVKSMIGLRVGVEDVATFIGCSHETLRKHFKEEIRTAKVEVDAQISQSLFSKAIGNGPGAVAAATYLSQVWLGWKPQPTEITGKDGEPIKTAAVVQVVFVKPPEYPPDPPLEESLKSS